MTNCLMVKVCVLGVTDVGKTSIASRYVQDTFNPDVAPTLGAAFLSRYCSAPKGTLYKFQIWDTAGQERYKTLAPLYYRGASVILIVYDISKRNTFTDGAKEWVKELRGKGLDDAQWVLIGNKHDLAASNREVSESEARKYAEDIGAMFYEASAKTGHNVNMIFGDIASNLEKSQAKTLLVKKEIYYSRGNRRDPSYIKVRTDSNDSEDDFRQDHRIIRRCCHA